jgi:hypothetical protein
VIRELGPSGQDRRALQLMLNSTEIGSFELPIGYPLQVAVHLPWVFVWGGTELYWHRISASGLSSRSFDDEIRAVYPLGTDWLVVAETSVLLLDADLREILDRLLLDEVVIDVSWSGEVLRLSDLRSRVVQLDFSARLDRTIPQPSIGCSGDVGVPATSQSTR